MKPYSLIKIPRNIFQTWKTKKISDGLKGLTQTWIQNNPNYAYFLYDDNDCDKFIKKYFDKKIYNAYCRIIPGAFKADLWRYCVLYIYGGVYVDMDTICMNSIDTFLNEDIELMTPIDLNNNPNIGTHNLFNAFIASIPKHPILLDCIHRIVYNVENNIIPFSNLDFAGPGILGRSTNTYLQLEEETSFIGKEGIYNNNICLLHFEQETEHVKGIKNNNILFQNKNGNTNIQQIYNEELNNINYVDWGKCNNPIKPLPTIVTMFYNIREKESNMSGSIFNHSIERYLDFAKKFILQLPYPLVIFTDNEQVVDIISQERKNYPTYIFKKPFEDTYFYKDLLQLEELQKKFTIINGYLEHETPMYIILNNNKFDFMESAIELNSFKSEHFIWMDFGINHVAQNTEKIHEWICNVPDKIKQLCINPYIENVENKQMFQNIYHHNAGGLFTGSKENMLTYSKLFKEKTEQIYAEDWYQIDEAIMTMVQRENPYLFDFFYGDYQGIISNYITPMHNIELILTSSQKYIDGNKLKEAFILLSYCSSYFIKNYENHNVFLFLHQNIIVNYYENNKLLTNYVIDLINLKQESENQIDREKIHALLEYNKANIDFYENKLPLLKK
jgi:mannosyltransferase OCH1-like enzyme